MHYYTGIDISENVGGNIICIEAENGWNCLNCAK